MTMTADPMNTRTDPQPQGSARCIATNRQGNRCGRPPAPGQRVCNLHGGKSPQAIRAAERRLVTERARNELARLGEPAAPVDDPAGALARICGEAVALVDVLRRHVSTAEDVAGPEVAAYLASLGRAESALSAALRAGVVERQQQLAEEQGALMAQVLRAVLCDPELLLTEAQSAVALQVASKHLRAIPATTA